MSIRGGGILGDITTYGTDRLGCGIGAISIVGGDVRGNITVNGGGIRSLALVGGDILGNIIVEGGIDKLTVRSARNRVTSQLVGGLLIMLIFSSEGLS